jgi:hypothetical protein
MVRGQLSDLVSFSWVSWCSRTCPRNETVADEGGQRRAMEGEKQGATSLLFKTCESQGRGKQTLSNALSRREVDGGWA